MTSVWIVGHVFVSGVRFIGPTLFEKSFVSFPSLRRMGGVITSFLGYPIAAPNTSPYKTLAGLQGITCQGMLPAFDLSSLILAIWATVLCLGAMNLWRSEDRIPVRLLGGWLISQLLLHIIYGEETFLYSLHWVPSLIVVASFACRGRKRVPVLIGVACLALAAGYSNEVREHAAIARLVAAKTL